MNMHADIPKALFDVRSLNVTKLDRVVDCDIAIAEADLALRGIARQMANPSFNRDRAWLVDANAAKEDIEQKRALFVIKRDALAASSGNQREIDARNAANKATLRDQFAMAALPAIMSAVAAGIVASPGGITGPKQFAAAAYENADAMLAARAKEADGTKPS